MSEIGSVGSGNLPPVPAPKGGVGGATASANLRPGDVVQVELQQTSGKGGGVLLLGGQLLRAVFPGDLPRGARLAMQVVSTGPPLVLQRADSSAVALGRLMSPPAQGLSSALSVFLGSGAAEGLRGELLRAARSLLQFPRDPAVLARSLAAWVGGSGVHHEAALARGRSPGDLKAILLQLLPQLNQLNQGSLKEAAESLLGHLQAHQARSVLQDHTILPLVLPWGEEWIRGEIHLDAEQGARGEGGEDGGSLRLQLHMPRLGRVEVGVRWTPAGVAIRLGAEASSVEPIRERLSELSRTLSESAAVRVVDLRAEPLPPPESGAAKGLVEVIA